MFNKSERRVCSINYSCDQIIKTFLSSFVLTVNCCMNPEPSENFFTAGEATTVVLGSFCDGPCGDKNTGNGDGVREWLRFLERVQGVDDDGGCGVDVQGEKPDVPGCEISYASSAAEDISEVCSEFNSERIKTT
jgi:hypothetical protein